jgi:hypothetical protein
MSKRGVYSPSPHVQQAIWISTNARGLIIPLALSRMEGYLVMNGVSEFSALALSSV